MGLIFPFKILKKQAQGRISVTSMVKNDPINAITNAKNGILRATNNVDITSAVLMRILYMCDLVWFDGINSSKLIATGAMVNAYFVNGLTIVVQKAILEATKSVGKFRVNWD